MTTNPTAAGISTSAFTSQTVVSLRCSVCGERYHQWGGDGANVFDDMPQAVKAATAEGWTVTLAPLTHEGRDHTTFAVCSDEHKSHAEARFLMLPPAPEIASVMDGQHPLFETEGA